MIDELDKQQHRQRRRLRLRLTLISSIYYIYMHLNIDRYLEFDSFILFESLFIILFYLSKSTCSLFSLDSSTGARSIDPNILVIVKRVLFLSLSHKHITYSAWYNRAQSYYDAVDWPRGTTKSAYIYIYNRFFLYLISSSIHFDSEDNEETQDKRWFINSPDCF